MIAKRFFTDFNFVPLVGEPVPCKAYVAKEQNIQPAGYDRVTDTQLEIIIFEKETIPLDSVDPGAFFYDLTDLKNYVVRAVSPDDQDVFGKVIVDSD